MIIEKNVSRILNTNKNSSGWFGVKYGMNLYRGCEHRCIYCDSRSECYRINNFDNDIEIKVNSLELLDKELKRKREIATVGFGAMTDPYTPLEKKYQLTRKALEIVKNNRYPVFILTKSNLVLRDIDIIEEINQQNYACVSFTLTTVDDELAKKIEPNAPLPSERLKAMGVISALGIKTGITMMPILPFIEDNKEDILNIVREAHKYGASFIYPAFGVTLRDRQRDYFYRRLDEIDPTLKPKYIKRFGNKYSCGISNYKEIRKAFNEECKKRGISYDMPSWEHESYKKQMSIFDL